VRAKTVLVVDDDPDIREALCALLACEGYVTITAANGAEAVAQMQAHRPCFVILDLMMPVMDGWEVRVRMQEAQELAAIPVAVVTASPEWAPLDSACVLTKPVDIPTLLRVIAEHCGTQH
jgi:two-component system, chemotaxis family, chemotaxis protein CheY